MTRCWSVWGHWKDNDSHCLMKSLLLSSSKNASCVNHSSLPQPDETAIHVPWLTRKKADTIRSRKQIFGEAKTSVPVVLAEGVRVAWFPGGTRGRRSDLPLLS